MLLENFDIALGFIKKKEGEALRADSRFPFRETLDLVDTA
jgi:hypothetical protein